MRPRLAPPLGPRAMLDSEAPWPEWRPPERPFLRLPSLPVRIASPPRPPMRAAAPGHALARVRDSIRSRHYSRRTERAYLGWIRRYAAFHAPRAVEELGAPEVARFLTTLATDGKVSAGTQNQAPSACRRCSRAARWPPSCGA